VTEALALSLANADLGSVGDLHRWLHGLEETAGLADELSLRLLEFLDLRSCLRDLLLAVAEGRPLPPGAVERLNETSARVPRVARLDGETVSLEPMAGSVAALVLARIAWSAIELLGGPDRDRVRRCGADGRLFVATRPDRVWCSDRCGNRIRVARHHARLRGPTYPVPG
jgi:predicted RNA-binding Zn ribbon-like protein